MYGATASERWLAVEVHPAKSPAIFHMRPSKEKAADSLVQVFPVHCAEVTVLHCAGLAICDGAVAPPTVQILHSTRSPLVPTYSLTANMMLQALPSRPTSAASSRPASPARAQQGTAQDRAGQQGAQHQQQQQQQQQRPAWARKPTEQEPCGPAVQPAAQRQAEQQRPEWDVRNLRRPQGWSQPPSRAPSRGPSRCQAGSTSLGDSQPPVVPPTRVVAKVPAAGSSSTSGATIGAHTWGPARILQRHAVEQTEPLGTVGGMDDSGGFLMSLPCYQKQHIVNTGCTVGWVTLVQPETLDVPARQAALQQFGSTLCACALCIQPG